MTNFRNTWIVAICAALLGVAATPAVAADEVHPRGFVDPSAFIDIVGDDAVTVEVSLGGALLKVLTGFDPELKKLAGGLESIRAIVLSPGDAAHAARIRALIASTQEQLKKKGWQRLARVQDSDAEVQVLALSDAETILGLVVMIVDHEEGEVVFANIAGKLDLAAIAAIGEGLDLPGLDRLEDLDVHP